MKYESELIKEIVDTRGHEMPLLHYESECVKSWIDEAKGAYPKLTDYRGEWLNYMVENPIGEFPYITLSDVTDATVDNVVPYAYKSAILKGNTLVNLAQSTKPTNLNGEYVFRDNFESLNFGCNMIKPSTTYTIISNIIENSANFLNLEWNSILDECAFKEIIRTDGSLGIRKFKVTSKDDLSNASKSIRFFPNNKQENGTLTITFMLLEGDYTKVDIPYFEGMQSVRMPVLTTTGKNLFDGKLELGGIYSNGSDVGNNQDGITDRVRSANYIPVNANTTYVLSDNEGNVINANFYEYDENKTFIYSNASVSSVNTKSSTKYIRFINRNTDANVKYQLEEGSIATSYEPYKSNILTVNEDVELRGVGDVKDELDCLTGEVIERTIKGVLGGSEKWIMWIDRGESSNIISFYFDIKNVPNKNNIVINDKFATYDGTNESHPYYSTVKETIMIAYGTAFGTRLCVGISKDKATNLSEFKAWLSSNNINYIVEANEKAHKTVDLSITDQDGNTLSKIKPIEGTMHLATSSDTLKPTFSGEIPVEATTQNLASFIEE